MRKNPENVTERGLTAFIGSSRQPISTPRDIITMKFGYVDALRGIAVLLVCLVHVGNYTAQDTVFTVVSKYGQYGVQLFFVMSAFTLCHSVRNLTFFTKSDYLMFFIRRFFRIAPLYYLALAGYTAYSFICFQTFKQIPFWNNPDVYNSTKILSNILFLHGLYPAGNNQMVPGGWSIGCEFLFYAMFPSIFFFTRTRQHVLPILIGIGIFISGFVPFALYGIGSPETPSAGSFSYFFISNQLVCFIFGIIYFHSSKKPWFRNLLKISLPFSVMALIAGQYCEIGWMFTPFAASIISLNLAMLLEQRHAFDWLIKIGQLSFSIYLVHFLFVWISCKMCIWKFPYLLAHSYSSLLLFIWIFGISTFVANITNRYIEKPFINLGRKMTFRQDSRAPSAQGRSPSV